MRKLLLVFFCFVAKNLWAQQPRLVLPIGHTNTVNYAAFSPNGKYIVTASDDKTAKIWDVQTGKLLSDLKGHTGEVKTATFSPDSKQVLTAAFDSTIRIWDAGNGKCLQLLKGNSKYTYSAFYSPDGKFIVTASLLGTPVIWNIATGEIVTRLYGHRGIESSVGERGEYFACYSPNGKYIVTASGDKTLKIWSKGGFSLFTLEGHTAKVIKAHFTADSKYIISIDGIGDTKIWDTEKGKLTQALAGSFRDFVFDSSMKHMLASPLGAEPVIFDNTASKVDLILAGHRYVNSVSYSPDEKLIVTASGDNTATIWKAKDGKMLFDLR